MYHFSDLEILRKQIAYKKGLITIQDESSMLPVVALDVKPGMKVLDMCAAPGGKTTHIAEKMNDEGEVYAHDIHEHKLALIEANADRLRSYHRLQRKVETAET